MVTISEQKGFTLAVTSRLCDNDSRFSVIAV